MQKAMIARAEFYKKKGLLKPMLENAKRLQKEMIEESRKVREEARRN